MLKHYLFLLFFSISSIIFCQNIITDRPDQTESSSTIAANNLQVEAGFQLLNTNFKNENLLPTFLFRYGISDLIELRLVTQFENIKIKNSSESINGLSDIEIGAKIQIFKKENAKIEVAFLSHLIIPTAKKALTNDAFGTINKLSISHPLGEKFSVGYNVGYNYFGSESGDFTYSLALGTSLTDKLGFYIEPYGEFTNFKTHIASFDAGLTYLLKSNLQLDISYGTGLNYTMNYYSAGVSWNIEKL